MDESPPVTSCFSSTITLAPAREASTAALMPVMPLPTTTRSASFVSCLSAGFSAAAWMVSGASADAVALPAASALFAVEPEPAFAPALVCGAQAARLLPAARAAEVPSPSTKARRLRPERSTVFP